MLNQETKRKIDRARDILVGKVPDPKAQVEQITTALIYKFMDDMDKEAEELGGKPRFFIKEFEKYAWTKLFDSRLGGFERLNLYVEALLKMPQNPYLPQLFRDILKDAFLPYRDPETLNLFLKEINGFTYDHSEKLGDAYEYLLSVLGSQGDAGQFRTPRHIIDFIVEVIAPRKDETILDPACGTAGFLISAYKYILRQNTEERLGDKLAPDERKKLTSHFIGCDISPDMVRLSLTNMYLHRFPNPNIYEYDTLTSEERWDETFDVIMANPPFMSPKGGIRPHKRFSIQATRSEVLFVDYIAEHLNVNGRAGVIVPEGVIFQSGGAYKALRKTLVEDKYLYAVISLPAGIFQPYSGVKTSILLMDKSLAKKTDRILFIKVSNDGFDLGAQRRPIDKNDLPKALAILKGYKQAIQEGNEFILDDDEVHMTVLVEKTKIALNGDYNLSAERYKEVVSQTNITWPMVDLGDICDLVGGGTPSKENKSFWENGTVKWVSARHINDIYLSDSDQKITEEAIRASSTNVVAANTIILVTRVSLGKMAITKDSFAINQDLTGLVIKDTSRIDTMYLFRILKCLAPQIEEAGQGLGVKGVTRDYVRGIKIPLPPLEVQQEIVAELDDYQKVIDGARQVVENYKPVINIERSWGTGLLGDNLEIIDGDRGINYPKKEEFASSGYCLFLSTKNVRKNGFDFGECEFITKGKDTMLRKGKIQKNDLVLTTRGTVGNIAIFDDTVPFEHIRINSGMVVLRVDIKRFFPKFLFFLFQTNFIQEQLDRICSGSAQPQLPIRSLVNVQIPIPPVKEQWQIATQLEEEQKFIKANKRLIEIFEQKIQDKLAKIWREDTSGQQSEPIEAPFSISAD